MYIFCERFCNLSTCVCLHAFSITQKGVTCMRWGDGDPSAERRPLYITQLWQRKHVPERSQMLLASGRRRRDGKRPDELFPPKDTQRAPL